MILQILTTIIWQWGLLANGSRIPLLNSQLPFAGIPSPGGAVTPGPL